MKRLLMLATLVLGVVSCMKDQPVEAGLAGDGNVVLSVALPADATRAAGRSSAVGAIDNNIDLASTYDIRYILEVFDASNTLAKRVENFEDTATETTFELRLIPGRHYSFVVWADFVERDANGDVTMEHYDASDLRNIEVIGAQNAMDESRDAYTAVFNTADQGEVFSSASTISMTLRRPFAKLRVVTNDMKEIYSTLDNAKVVYTSKIYKMYDALTTEPSEAVRVEKEYDFDATTAYANEASVNGEKCPTKTLFADYLLGTEDGTVQFVMTITDDVETLPAINFNTAIPVERNHLTTIYGPVLTDFNKVTVTIDDNFAQPEHIVDVWDGVSISEPTVEPDPVTGEPVAVIDSASDFAWLAGYVNGTQASTFATRGDKVVNFVLGADIDLGNHQWTPIGYWETFEGTFDGNGHTISNLKHHGTEEDCYVGLFGYTENATIKNLTISNVDIKLVANNSWAGGHMGALVGNIEGNTVIENIKVVGDIKIDGDLEKAGAGRIGAVVGGNVCNATFKNVVVNANEGSFVKGNSSVGGIAGQLQGNVVFDNCSSNIDVTAQVFAAGGIVGLAPKTATFTRCSTSGNISVANGGNKLHNQYRVGGIAGSWDDHLSVSLTLENCETTCVLSGKNANGVEVTAFDCDGYVGRGYSALVGAKVVVNGVEYTAYFVGGFVDVDGVKAIIYTLEDGVKAVSVEQGGEMTWDESMAWAQDLGNGWALASLEDMQTIYGVRSALNSVLSSDANNALFEEDNKEEDGTYAAYWTSTLVEGTSTMPKAYYMYFDDDASVMKSFTMFPVEYSRAVYSLGHYNIGDIVDANGVKAVVYSVDNGVKAVSVEQKNLNGLNATDAAAWAEGLGEGWSLASIYELDAIHASRFALNKALAADSADNALFCETEYYADGKYALYISSTDAEGNDPQGQAYFSNRVHVKYFNLNGYWDYNYSTFATISKYAPLKDNHFARAVYAL